MTDPAAPISKYAEVRFAGPVEYELYADKLVVRGRRYLHGSFERTIPLSSMSPETGRYTVPNPLFALGLLLFLFGGIGTLWLAVDGTWDWDRFAAPFFSVFGVAGVVVAALTARSDERLYFATQAGLPVVSFTTSRAPVPADLEVFLQELRARIPEQVSGSSNAPPQPTGSPTAERQR